MTGLQTALENTHAVIWVRCTRGSRWAKLGQLLAFARATSDKALTATIWDVAVRPWPQSTIELHLDCQTSVLHLCSRFYQSPRSPYYSHVHSLRQWSRL